MADQMLCFEKIWAPKEISLFTSICSLVISLMSCIGNGIIIMAVIKDPYKKLYTPFNYFLVNLAVSDLIVGCVTMPISVYAHFQEYKGIITTSGVTLVHLSQLISGTASLLSLLVLALDRYSAISDAIKYRTTVSWRRCIITSVVIWCVSLTLPFIQMIIKYINYLTFFVCTAILIGSVVMVTVYFKVNKIVKKQTLDLAKHYSESEQRAKKKFILKRLTEEHKITKAFFTMTFVYLMIYLPAAVIILLLQLCTQCGCTLRHILRDVQFLLISLTCFTNPFVCTLRSQIFKKAIKNILCGNNTNGASENELSSHG
ncbi:5-hydroxytryptamine receptor 2C-like [Clytia hemisphaerica]|uniref:5-hydroxytryptamine receptor 2C-like n=1 Tax=Clytia hemisphaerica TaxID=252671 RepID=UPI0034D4E981